MRTEASPSDLRAAVMSARCSGQSVGLVPTMGYLHSGHLKLMEAARAENDLVIMSVYVNPTQFGPSEDFGRYPRDLPRDSELAAGAGVDILFVPQDSDMYPDGAANQTIWVNPGDVAKHLCGRSRPDHFRGVATVVTKLLNLVQPDRAYFGQKDGQQVVVVRRLVRDLKFPVQIRVVPTVREQDGLALSSRNVFLSPLERLQAVALSEALERAREMIETGQRGAEGIERAMTLTIQERAPLGRVDYVSVAKLDTLEPVRGEIRQDVLLALAVYFGSTRLIDNMIVNFERDGTSFQK